MKKRVITLGLALAFTTTISMATTAATVNDIEITVNEANKALKVLSKDKMTWDKLSKDKKEQLIKMMAPSKLVSEASKKELSKKEKEAALSNFWMQKSMSKMSISDEKAKVAYEKLKKAAMSSKSKNKIPTFEQAKKSIKIQLAQEEIVRNLMKKADIKIK
jgi:hypothetical protein